MAANGHSHEKTHRPAQPRRPHRQWREQARAQRGHQQPHEGGLDAQLQAQRNAEQGQVHHGKAHSGYLSVPMIIDLSTFFASQIL